MKQNAFIKPIKIEVEQTENKLIYFQFLLDSWIKCQRGWMYLEPIFSSDEMKTEMPQEREYFVTVDENWRKIMSFIQESPLIYNHSELEVISKMLGVNIDLLEKINKELNTYLEKKRHLFPRFYFLSDEELLVILSKAKDPTLVKKYINKCFDSIDTIEFN